MTTIRIAATGRSCGTCSLCCKLPAIPELAKPANEWCEHCRPGKGGCGIYAARPQVCRSYNCYWLIGLLGDEWQPTKSKMVVQSEIDESRGRRLLFLLDHSTPDRWREPPYYKQILAWSERGLSAEPSKRYTTYVVVGGRTDLILPSGETMRIEKGERGTLDITCSDGQWKASRRELKGDE